MTELLDRDFRKNLVQPPSITDGEVEAQEEGGTAQGPVANGRTRARIPISLTPKPNPNLIKHNKTSYVFCN